MLFYASVGISCKLFRRVFPLRLAARGYPLRDKVNFIFRIALRGGWALWRQICNPFGNDRAGFGPRE